MLARSPHTWLVGKENDGPSFQTAGSAALQLAIGVLWHTCRIITWCIWLVCSKGGTSGCTWVGVRRVVRSSVESALNIFLVFCVLVECAGFGRQQGHVVTERVQWSAVTRGGRLTQLLCYLYKVQKRSLKYIWNRLYLLIYALDFKSVQFLRFTLAVFEPWYCTFRNAGVMEHCLKGLMDLCKWRPVQGAPLPAWKRNRRKQKSSYYKKVLY